MVVTACPAKVKFVGDKLTPEAVPVPLKETVWGLPDELSVTVRVPVREPTAVGVNVRFTVQLLLAARAVPQLLF